MEGKREEDLDLATQLRLPENGDLLLQVEKIKLLGKKTNKGRVSEEEVSIDGSLEARGGIQEGAERLGLMQEKSTSRLGPDSEQPSLPQTLAAERTARGQQWDDTHAAAATAQLETRKGLHSKPSPRAASSEGRRRRGTMRKTLFPTTNHPTLCSWRAIQDRFTPSLQDMLRTLTGSTSWASTLAAVASHLSPPQCLFHLHFLRYQMRTERPPPYKFRVTG